MEKALFDKDKSLQPTTIVLEQNSLFINILNERLMDSLRGLLANSDKSTSIKYCMSKGCLCLNMMQPCDWNEK